MNNTRIVRTRSGDKLHLCSEGSTHMHCGSSWGYHPIAVRWVPGAKFCGRCCSPDGIKIIRAIVSFLTLTAV